MFVYQKKLQYPVRIRNTNPKLAAQIITQYGGPECSRVSYGFPKLPLFRSGHPWGTRRRGAWSRPSG